MADTTDITMSIGLEINEAEKSARDLEKVYGRVFDSIQKRANSQLANIGKLQKEFQFLNAKRSLAAATPEDLQRLAEVRERLQGAEEILGRIFAEMDEKQSSPFIPLIEDMIQFSDLSDETLNKLREMTGDMSGAERTGLMFKNSMDLIIKTLTNFAKHPIKSIVSALKIAFSGLGTAISKAYNGLKKIVSVITKVAKGFKNLVNTISSKLNPSLKGTGKGLSNATGLLKKFILAGIGVRSIYFLFRKFWNMVKEGVNIMAQVDEETNRALSSVKTATYTLQKQIGSMFSTLVQAVAPAIVMIVNLLTKAMTVATQFFAALGGKSTYKKATTQMQDYAASLDSSSKSTKKADEENKKYMSGLDEIATFEDKSDDKTDDSGSGTDLANAFEEAPIESKFADFVQRLKDLWNAGEFYQLGYEMAEALANGLDKIYDLISWDNVGEKITYYCNAFTEIINGIIGNEHFWESLGAVIGAGINTVIQTLYLLITGIKWEELGKSLATSFNRIIKEIDWATLGKLVAEWFLTIPKIVVGFIKGLDVKAVGDAISTFFKNAFDTASKWIQDIGKDGGWQELGQKVKDLIVSIDWAGIADSLFELLGSALGGLAAFLWGLIKDAFMSVVDWWNSNALDEYGKFTIEGLFNGIVEALKNIGTWIKEHIFKPFIDGFKKAFGIASPSKEMESMGKFIMEGLFNGISSLVNKVKEIWNNIKTFTKNIFTNIKTDIVTIINAVKTSISNVLNSIKTTWTTVWTSMKTTVINIFNGIWSGIKRIINTILNGVQNMANKIASGLNKLIEKLNGFQIDVPDWAQEKFGLGSSFGLNIPTIPEISISPLATGAVIPANSPFLAMLGDQKSGTNIEAPLDTIKQAVAEVIGNGVGGNSNYEFVAQINRRTLFDEMISEAKLRKSASGRNPFEFA